jgi:Domain of unknown function (DUF4170)
MAKPKPKAKPQLLHLVFGGELKHTQDIEFKDLSKLDIVGMYPNFAEAKAAWLGKAQATVDNAQMRYFVAHIHRLFEEDEEPKEDEHDHDS